MDLPSRTTTRGGKKWRLSCRNTAGITGRNARSYGRKRLLKPVSTGGNARAKSGLSTGVRRRVASLRLARTGSRAWITLPCLWITYGQNASHTVGCPDLALMSGSGYGRKCQPKTKPPRNRFDTGCHAWKTSRSSTAPGVSSRWFPYGRKCQQRLPVSRILVDLRRRSRTGVLPSLGVRAAMPGLASANIGTRCSPALVVSAQSLDSTGSMSHAVGIVARSVIRTPSRCSAEAARIPGQPGVRSSMSNHPFREVGGGKARGRRPSFRNA